MPLEAETFFICRRQGWSPVHAYRYGDPPDTREIDVLGVKTIKFEDSGTKLLTGQVILVIECKYATQWWVFTDLSGLPARNEEFMFPPESDGLGLRVASYVVDAVRDEWKKEHSEPARTWSTRELSFSYENVKREQFYPGSRQALSAMQGLEVYRAGVFSTQNPNLLLFVPVVMTSRELIVARVLEGADEFEFEETDWLITGDTPELVHVVTASGLERLLAFLNDVIEGLNAPATHKRIWELFGS